MPAVVGPREPIQWNDVLFSEEPLRARFEVAMRGLVDKPAPYVALFPNTDTLQIVSGIITGRPAFFLRSARLDPLGAALLALSRYTND